MLMYCNLHFPYFQMGRFEEVQLTRKLQISQKNSNKFTHRNSYLQELIASRTNYNNKTPEPNTRATSSSKLSYTQN